MAGRAERAWRNELPAETVGACASRDEDVEGFLTALAASGLFPPGAVSDLARELDADPSRTLAELLVDSGRLTAYQFDRIRRGEPDGLVVGPYTVLDELGRGGGGRVYKARHGVIGRVVALKVIDADFRDERTVRDLFRREVTASGRLAHPNVAQIYDANEYDGLLCLAMEFVDGPTLHHHIAENGPLDPAVACAALTQTAEALQHAHEAGLVHRDLKPANIMFPAARGDRDGAPRELVKVVDFGLARLRPHGGQRLTTIYCPDGAAVGTPAFMAPEQIRDVHTADIRSDLYSLGCSFYFALTGRLPFEAASIRVTLAMHLEQEPVPLRTLRPDVPAGLAGVVHRLMAKRPADRYQTPADVTTALRDFMLSEVLASVQASGTGAVVELDSVRPTPLVSVATVPSPLALPTLRRLWLVWCAVVEGLARGERPLVSGARYAELYQGLIDAIGRAEGAPGLTDVYRDRLRTAVEPWVNLRSLQQLDAAARADLWRVCQGVGAGLGAGATAGASRSRSTVYFLAACVLLAAIVSAAVAWERVAAALG